MASVLFVDDERAVLTALRVSLHRERGRWELVFVGSAAEALAALERRPFDVIVSDLNMPDMDGVELLSHVRDAHPAIRRVILSGNVQEAATERAREVVHEFLGKPCPTAVIRECLSRWLAQHAA